MSDHKKVDDLIQHLEGDLQPVKCLSCPAHRAGMWVFAGIFSTILVGAFTGFRTDIMDKIQEPVFLSEIVFILLLNCSAAYASAWLSLPDGAQRRNIIYLPYIVVMIGLSLLFLEMYKHGMGLENLHFHHCIMDAMALGTIPIMLMIWMMRQGAPTHPILGAVTNMIAAGAIGYLGLRLTCGSDNMGHVCLYHIFPFIFIGLVMGLLARRLYRW